METSVAFDGARRVQFFALKRGAVCKRGEVKWEDERGAKTAPCVSLLGACLPVLLAAFRLRT